MENYPFISVIVPVYQAEDYIEACLKSICSQDYLGKIECILIDDCSNDTSMLNARRFIDAYIGDVSFQIYCSGCTKGASAARNIGICHASGEYIFFMDSDDCLASNAISALATPLLFYRYDMVVGRYQETGLRNRVNVSLPGETVLFGSDILFPFLKDQISSTVWNKLIKTAFIKENELFFYEGIIFEDILWSFQSAIMAKSLFVVDVITYFYSVRGGSVMTSTSLSKRMDSYKAIIPEMFRFSVAHHLKNNQGVHEWIEGWRWQMLEMLLNDRFAFKNAYNSLRKMMPKRWLDCFLMDGLHPYKQIRDFHMALPATLGAKYYCLFIRADGIKLKIGAFIRRLFF